MIKFTLGDKPYGLRFWYEKDLTGVPLVTYGEIVLLEGDYPPVWWTSVTRYFKDRPCYATARKLVLKKLIQHLKREERAIVWKAYHGRIAGSRNCTDGEWL